MTNNEQQSRDTQKRTHHLLRGRVGEQTQYDDNERRHDEQRHGDVHVVQLADVDGPEVGLTAARLLVDHLEDEPHTAQAHPAH